MGKGNIISGSGTPAQYTIKVDYNDKRLIAKRAKIEADITDLENNQIPTAGTELTAARTAVNDALTAQNNGIDQYNAQAINQAALNKLVLDVIQKQIELKAAESKLAMLRAKLAALQTEKNNIDKYRDADLDATAWCADYTSDLTGDVGTIEINGEHQNGGAVIIRPGYQGSATYDKTRDGQLQQFLASGGSAIFWNKSILPGWQKWKPTYRIGTVTAKNNNMLTVDLDSAQSSQQGLSINKLQTLENVPVTYMQCNDAAFVIGDRVVVEFQGQDNASPRVIGFEQNPRPCDGWFENFDGLMWDLGTSDDPTTWPAACKSATTPYNPVSGSLPAGAFDSWYMATIADYPTDTYQPAFHATITNDGHKLYYPAGYLATIANGAISFPPLAVSGQWTGSHNDAHISIIFGDGRNLLKPDASANFDPYPLTTWKRFELDYEMSPRSPTETEPNPEWNLRICLFDHFTDDYNPVPPSLFWLILPWYGVNLNGNVCYAINVNNVDWNGRIDKNPALYPNSFPSRYDSSAMMTWDRDGERCYKAGIQGALFLYNRSTTGTVVIDRTTMPELSIPNSQLRAITIRSSVFDGWSIRGIRFIY